jgi:hypothetical protein
VLLYTNFNGINHLIMVAGDTPSIFHALTIKGESRMKEGRVLT